MIEMNHTTHTKVAPEVLSYVEWGSSSISSEVLGLAYIYLHKIEFKIIVAGWEIKR